MVWNSPPTTRPVPSGWSFQGDSWATSGGYSGLEYASAVLHNFSTAQYCIGIGATDAQSMAFNSWTHPATSCTTAVGTAVPDGPSIHYDQGGTALYAVADSPTISLHIFPSCKGAVGGPQCPEKKGASIPQTHASHATVTVNPCTHHAIVAHHDLGDGVVLRFFDMAGKPQGKVGGFTVENSVSFGPVSDCTNLTGGDGGAIPRCQMSVDANGGSGACSNYVNACARLAPKVQVATNAAGGQCFAYVAYDSTYKSKADQHTYMRANLAVVNITSEASAHLVGAIQRFPNNPGDTHNAFGSIVSASYFTRSVGWFYYVQNYDQGGANDPCTTTYEGQTNTTADGSGAWKAQNLSTSFGPLPFPTLRVDGADYVGIVQRGVPGGALLPSWHQAVQSNADVTTPGCMMCLGTSYTMAIFAQTVTP